METELTKQDIIDLIVGSQSVALFNSMSTHLTMISMCQSHLRNYPHSRKGGRELHKMMRKAEKDIEEIAEQMAELNS